MIYKNRIFEHECPAPNCPCGNAVWDNPNESFISQIDNLLVEDSEAEADANTDEDLSGLLS
jgi:hypothetical protein